MAVVDYIPVANPQNRPQPAKLLQVRNLVAQLIAVGEETVGIMNHNFTDQGSLDFSALETLFGIPTGTGQTVFDMVNGLMGALNGAMQNSQAVNLRDRVG